ncbi:MAG: SLBB domain-containing protein [Candidatus Omnitrophica bacterium]|nr:SLBB domain-containing protein [Candidatus Omnitrophota bacterium]
MKKKILVFSVICSFLFSQPLSLLAQQNDINEISAQLEETTKNLEKLSNGEEAYRKFTCPACERQFEIGVDPNDIELKKGIKKVICPYDGTEFYPQIAGTTEQELQYETIRCPNCGREFKSYIDVKALLSGQSQVLTCPYDKRKFYFKAEGFRPAILAWANLQTVICPADNRTFKAYVDPTNLKELTCPYDGTKFFPTPELIIPQQGMASGLSSSGIGSAMKQTTSGNGLGDAALPTMVSQVTGIAQRFAPEEKPSRIEQMFSEHIPLSVSTAMKQFGYDMFKPVEKISQEKEQKDQGAQATGESGNKLLNVLLGTGQQDKMSVAGGGSEGGLSIFSTPAEIPVINDYILGPGDMLKVSVWGQIQEVFPLTIDSEGKVLLPKVGPLYLWGVKFSDAEKLIKENLLKAYTNIEVSVSMGRLRGIKVFVLGESQKPGAYTISALSNTFHALYAAGGPSKIGSMRNIKLVRKGSADMPVDLYNILLKGDNSQDYKLESGDTIFIPPIGDVVGVAGNVKRPAIYELKDKIKLSDMIDMAGGFSSVSYLQRIQLERIQEHLRKVVVDLEFKSLSDLKNSDNNLELQDGDLILIFPITPIRYNFVSISGNILRPGDYELKQGMRLKDLIDKAGGILPGTYLKRAEVSRFKGDQTREIMPISLMDLMDNREEANITLKEWDTVTIYSRKEVMPNLFVAIDGAVNNPGKYELTENMKASDLVFRAGGLKSSALLSNAELFRSFADSGPKVFNVDLGQVMSKDIEQATKNDVVLEEGDHLFVREDTTKGEQFIITVSGEFKYPGKYAVEKGAKLSAVIKRAGGFTDKAFLDGCIFTRESVRVAQQRMLKTYIESEQKALLQEQSSMAVGLTPAQADSRNKLIEYRKNLMQQLESVDMPGRVLIRLSGMNKFENSEYDITIEDGDTLSIPIYPSTVQVLWNVYGAGVVTFSEGKGIDYYIQRTGGVTKYADVNRIFIIRANGETISSFVRAVKVKRGDAIIVPEEFKYRTVPGLVFKDFVQVLYQATLGAAVTIAAINTM